MIGADSERPREKIPRNPRRGRVRDYGSKQRLTRKLFAPSVLAGLVKCSRCGELIEPGSSWDLAHDDYDRRFYSARSTPAATEAHHTATSRPASGSWLSGAARLVMVLDCDAVGPAGSARLRASCTPGMTRPGFAR